MEQAKRYKRAKQSKRRSRMNAETMTAIIMSGFFAVLIAMTLSKNKPVVSATNNETQIEAVSRGYARFETIDKTVKFIWNEPEK